ncbi:MAG: Ig-like domain-containing protein [Gemmatimonadaceae bacterium]
MKKRTRNSVLVAIIAGMMAIDFACANPSTPPGGPPDKEPPVILKITPANGTIGTRPKFVSFQFDEVVSESPKGAQDLSKLVFISPKSGDPEVDWRRSQIDIRPKKGWKPNTVYTVTVGAGIMDLRNNSIDSTTRIVFSTGGPIPDTKITGVAFDWQVGRGASKAIVEAIARDSTTYQTIADSIGRYSLEHLPPGQWSLRAFVDRNLNRLLEPREPFDTASVTLTQNANVDFYAFSHDTIGLRIADLTMTDSNTTIRISFDAPIGLNQAISTTQIVVQKADSTTLAVKTVFSAPVRQQFDSLLRKARADSIARAAPPLDTSMKARTTRDSTARVKYRDSLALVQRQQAEERRLLLLRGGKAPPPKDTTPPPKMSRPSLFTDIYVTLDKPLEPNTAYRVTARNVRSISGTMKSPARSFKTQPKETPKDSLKNSPSDSVKKTPPPKPPGNGRQ